MQESPNAQRSPTRRIARAGLALWTVPVALGVLAAIVLLNPTAKIPKETLATICYALGITYYVSSLFGGQSHGRAENGSSHAHQGPTLGISKALPILVGLPLFVLCLRAEGSHGIYEGKSQATRAGNQAGSVGHEVREDDTRGRMDGDQGGARGQRGDERLREDPKGLGADHASRLDENGIGHIETRTESQPLGKSDRQLKQNAGSKATDPSRDASGTTHEKEESRTPPATGPPATKPKASTIQTASLFELVKADKVSLKGVFRETLRRGQGAVFQASPTYQGALHTLVLDDGASKTLIIVWSTHQNEKEAVSTAESIVASVKSGGATLVSDPGRGRWEWQLTISGVPFKIEARRETGLQDFFAYNYFRSRWAVLITAN